MLCAQVQLKANGLVVHDYFVPPWPIQKLSLPIPKAATASGKLSLSCAEHKGIGGTGRTCNIAEVWLRKASSQSGVHLTSIMEHTDLPSNESLAVVSPQLPHGAPAVRGESSLLLTLLRSHGCCLCLCQTVCAAECAKNILCQSWTYHPWSTDKQPNPQ